MTATAGIESPRSRGNNSISGFGLPGTVQFPGETRLGILTPHFGKELTLLAWSTEDMDDSLLPNIISNWLGLEPEERWWLYTTVNATFTKAEIGKDRGWRKAIRIAFSENPVPEMPAERFIRRSPYACRKRRRAYQNRRSSNGTKEEKAPSIKKNSQINLFEGIAGTRHAGLTFIETQFPVSKVSKESYKEEGKQQPDAHRPWKVVG